ncbi:hypothetical protein BpHYR1_027687 [Brachionus plicatilis]|uniref:Uncharacterized protein n=1 Tax=Brachionus plicatilis TaxID=10195 RepID=A0A3M7QUP1_BRAPC|nr:hypothetical protein BpHYR1_027687 [Brachionus plicatilis]
MAFPMFLSNKISLGSSIDERTFDYLKNIKRIDFQSDTMKVIQNSESKWLNSLAKSNANVTLACILREKISAFII